MPRFARQRLRLRRCVSTSRVSVAPLRGGVFRLRRYCSLPSAAHRFRCCAAVHNQHHGGAAQHSVPSWTTPCEERSDEQYELDRLASERSDEQARSRSSRLQHEGGPSGPSSSRLRARGRGPRSGQAASHCVALQLKSIAVRCTASCDEQQTTARTLSCCASRGLLEQQVRC